MAEVTCRDCGVLGDEAPDDPAPNLCPTCYGARLAKISDKFGPMAESLESPILVTMWLEEALVDIGGETREAAHAHASALFNALLEP